MTMALTSMICLVMTVVIVDTLVEFRLELKALDLRSIPSRRNASTYKLLDASFNELTIITRDFFHYTGLVKLNLSVNSLRSLAERPFRNNAKLRIIDMSHNRLRALENDVFEGIDTLTTLFLNSNNLHSFDIMILQHLRYFTNLNLDLSRNENLPCLSLCYIHYFTFRVRAGSGITQRKALVCTQGIYLNVMTSAWDMCLYWCRDDLIWNSNVVDTSASLISGTLQSKRRCTRCYTQLGMEDNLFVVTCDLRHGQWVEHVQCQRVTCPNPPLIDHVEYLGSSDLSCPGWIDFRCEKGYRNIVDSMLSMQCSQGDVGNVTGIWRNSWLGGNPNVLIKPVCISDEEWLILNQTIDNSDVNYTTFVNYTTKSITSETKLSTDSLTVLGNFTDSPRTSPKGNRVRNEVNMWILVTGIGVGLVVIIVLTVGSFVFLKKRNSGMRSADASNASNEVMCMRRRLPTLPGDAPRRQTYINPYLFPTQNCSDPLCDCRFIRKPQSRDSIIRSVQHEIRLKEHVYETIPGDELPSYPPPTLPGACSTCRKPQSYIKMAQSEPFLSPSTSEPQPCTSTSEDMSMVGPENMYTSEPSLPEPCTLTSGYISMGGSHIKYTSYKKKSTLTSRVVYENVVLSDHNPNEKKQEAGVLENTSGMDAETSSEIGKKK